MTAPAQTAPSVSYTYRGEITRVVDGDTLMLSIDLGLSVWQREQTFRLARIDAPELTTPEGQVAAQRVADHLGLRFDPGRPSAVGAPVACVVTTKKDRRDPYRRYVAEVWGPAGDNLSDWLLSQGLARPYP